MCATPGQPITVNVYGQESDVKVNKREMIMTLCVKDLMALFSKSVVVYFRVKKEIQAPLVNAICRYEIRQYECLVPLVNKCGCI